MSSNQLKAKNFWSVKAENITGGSAVGHLYLYGLISSESWWGDEVTPKQLLDDLKTLGDITALNVHIFSDGGDIFAGTAIYTMLKQHKAPVTVYIEGIAASIATVIAMAGDQIYISRSGMMYIHNAMLGLCGYYNAGEMEVMIKELEKLREPIIAAYQAKTGKSRDEIIALMDGEDKGGTWFTASDAIAAGFATAYIPEESDTVLDCVACLAPNVYRWNGVTLDLSQYANAPQLPIKKNKARRKNGMGNQATKNNKNSKRTPQRPRNNVKAELIEITCPDCGATFQWDVAQDEGATLIEVTCPECGASFEWDTVQGEESTSASNELLEVTCPDCGATFEWEVDQGEPDSGNRRKANHKRKSAVNEIFTVTCPDCGATFEWEVDQGEPDSGAGNKKVDKYTAGVAAERKRITALDSIAAAYPEAGKLVARAKAEGWSYDKASRQVFAMMARISSDAANQDAAAGAAFLNGFAKDTATGGRKVGAKPNSGNGDDGKGDEASEIANLVNIYGQMKSGGKRYENNGK